MQGYMLYRDQNGTVTKATAEGATKKHLIRALDALAPDTATIVGLVLGPPDAQFLKLVA